MANFKVWVPEWLGNEPVDFIEVIGARDAAHAAEDVVDSNDEERRLAQDEDSVLTFVLDESGEFRAYRVGGQVVLRYRAAKCELPTDVPMRAAAPPQEETRDG